MWNNKLYYLIINLLIYDLFLPIKRSGDLIGNFSIQVENSLFYLDTDNISCKPLCHPLNTIETIPSLSFHDEFMVVQFCDILDERNRESP
jgi:hypothetical protein